MNGAGGTAVKQIMKAIENGSLPTNETQRRLMALIENEANRTDGPADEDLISACMDLLERLQGRTYTEDEARITALNQRIAAAIAKKEKQRRMVSMAVRLVAAAAVILLFVGVCVSWFEHSNTPDGQQHIITGQEITVEMVQAAIAENAGKGSFETTDLQELQQVLGFNPQIPEVIADEWQASVCNVWFMRNSIQVTVTYASAKLQDEHISYVIAYYSDVGEAQTTLEQSYAGTDRMISDVKVYVTHNIDNQVACWNIDNVVYELNAGINESDFFNILITILEGNNK